jgi:ring-1,2-phenylacetyl-CoA epoxidase subunit PaaE
MAKFYKLKVADVKKETADCVSISFEVPQNLKKEYEYIQGQYLTLKLTDKGEELRRSYSICSSPIGNEELRIAIKKVKEGRGSNILNNSVKKGDELEVMTPMGNFYCELNPANKKNYILFAGGSGITPMLSIIKTTLNKEPGSSVILFYGNRDEESIIFKKDLEEIQQVHSPRFKLVNILEKFSDSSSELFNGLLTEEKTKALIENYVDLSKDNEFFICGPGPMMESVKLGLTHLNVEKQKIHIEYFTTSSEAVSKVPDHKLPVMDSRVKILLDGEETEFTLSTNGDSILDAAINADLDVPFACKGAVCCTCKAKLLEGKVYMEMNYALSDEEVASGYILTCQSHPVTPTVVVDYDHN